LFLKAFIGWPFLSQTTINGMYEAHSEALWQK
jgi:hypothetical protein